MEIAEKKVYNTNKEGMLLDKRYIAPIIITILAVIYLLGMAAAFFSALLQGMPFVLFLLLVIVPVGAAAGIVYMLIQRIREIRGGEEDEAGKY